MIKLKLKLIFFLINISIASNIIRNNILKNFDKYYNLSNLSNLNNFNLNNFKSGLNNDKNLYKYYMNHILQIEHERQKSFEHFLKLRNKNTKLLKYYEDVNYGPIWNVIDTYLKTNKNYIPKNYYIKLHLNYLNELARRNLKNNVKSKNIKLIDKNNVNY